MNRGFFVACAFFLTVSQAFPQPATPKGKTAPYPTKAKYVNEVLRCNYGQANLESLAVSTDGKLLALGEGSRRKETARFHIIETATGKILRTISEHQGSITSLVFSADNLTIFSCSSDRTIGMWEIKTGKELKRFDGHKLGVGFLALSADGKQLISCTEEMDEHRPLEKHEFRLWDVEQGKLVRAYPLSKPVPAPSNAFSFDSNGNMVPVTHETFDGHLLMKFSSNAKIALFAPSFRGGSNKLYVADEMDEKHSPRLRNLGDLTTYFTSVAITTDGKMAASAYHNDLKIRYWDIDNCKMLREVQAPRQPVVGIAFSPDGKRIALEQSDGSVRVWDVKTDVEQLHTEAIGVNRVGELRSTILFSPNGRSLITTYRN